MMLHEYDCISSFIYHCLSSLLLSFESRIVGSKGTLMNFIKFIDFIARKEICIYIKDIQTVWVGE